MNKFQFSIAIAFITACVSCGPSAEDQALAEKERQDSAAAAQEMMKAAEEAAIQQADAEAAAAAATAETMGEDTAAVKAEELPE